MLLAAQPVPGKVGGATVSKKALEALAVAERHIPSDNSTTLAEIRGESPAIHGVGETLRVSFASWKSKIFNSRRIEDSPRHQKSKTSGDGDESDNSATPAGIKHPDSVSWRKHNEQKLAVGLGSARTTKAIKPFPRGRLRGRGDTAGKTRPSLVCACPPWSFERRCASFVMTRTLRVLEPHEGQAGRWHGPCPDAGKPATGGIPAVSPRRTGCTVQADTASEWTRNTPHPSRARRIAHEPGIASPDPIRQARRCQRGRGTGPLSRAGILALQGGEDVKMFASYLD